MFSFRLWGLVFDGCWVWWVLIWCLNELVDCVADLVVGLVVWLLLIVIAC